MNSVRRSRSWSRTSRRKIVQTFGQSDARPISRGPAPADRRQVLAALGPLDQVEEQLLQVGLAEPVEQLARLPLGLDPPLVDDRHPRAELLDLVHRVGREDDRLALVAQLGDLLEDRPGHQDVEPRGRLVEDQDGRVVDDRPGDRDLLPHPGRHLRAEDVAEVVHLEPVEDRLHPLAEPVLAAIP